MHMYMRGSVVLYFGAWRIGGVSSLGSSAAREATRARGTDSHTIDHSHANAMPSPQPLLKL